MTTTAALVAEIRRLKDELRARQAFIEEKGVEIRNHERRYAALLANIRDDRRIPADVCNHIVLNLQPKFYAQHE